MTPQEEIQQALDRLLNTARVADQAGELDHPSSDLARVLNGTLDFQVGLLEDGLLEHDIGPDSHGGWNYTMAASTLLARSINNA